MTNEKAVVVNEGATYESKNEDTDGTKARVVAFKVDRPRSQVLFAPLGSGQEDRTTIDKFLKDYDLVAQQGEPLPEDKEAAQKAARNAPRASTERKDVSTPRLDTTKASPTRADLEGRTTARNSEVRTTPRHSEVRTTPRNSETPKAGE